MVQKFQNQAKHIYFMFGYGPLVISLIFYGFLFKNLLTEQYNDSGAILISLFCCFIVWLALAMGFARYMVRSAQMSYLEISAEGTLYNRRYRRSLARWENIKLLGPIPGNSDIHAFCNDMEEISGAQFFLRFLKSENMDNIIPIESFIPNWQEVLAEYIEKYNIPVQKR